MTTLRTVRLSIDSAGAKQGADIFTRAMRDIATQTKATNRTLATTEGRFLKLASASRRLGVGLRRAFREADTAGAVAKLAADMASLGSSVRALTKQSLTNTNALTRQAGAMARLDRQTDRTRKSVSAYIQRERGRQQATKGANQEAQRGIGILGTFGSRVASVALGFAAFNTITAGVRAVTGSIRSIAEFEETLIAVRNVVIGTGDAAADGAGKFLQLEAAARRLGATTRFTATEVGDAQLFLGRAGLNADQILSALPSTLDLAQVGFLDLGRAADIASNVLTQFGIRAGEFESVVDTLIVTTNSSNTNVEQLARALSFVGPAAASVGVEVGEAAAVIGTLGDAGIQASLAGTNVRNILVSLISPSEKAKAAIQEIGLTLDQVNPEIVGLEDAFRNFAAAGLDAASAAEIFNRRNISAALALAENVSKVGELRAASESLGGEAGRAAEELDKSLVGRSKTLSAAFESLALSVGDAGLTNVLKGAVDQLTSLTRGIDGLIKVQAGVDRAPAQFAGEAIDRIGESIDGLQSRFASGSVSGEDFFGLLRQRLNETIEQVAVIRQFDPQNFERSIDLSDLIRVGRDPKLISSISEEIINSVEESASVLRSSPDARKALLLLPEITSGVTSPDTIPRISGLSDTQAKLEASLRASELEALADRLRELRELDDGKGEQGFIQALVSAAARGITDLDTLEEGLKRMRDLAADTASESGSNPIAEFLDSVVRTTRVQFNRLVNDVRPRFEEVSEGVLKFGKSFGEATTASETFFRNLDRRARNSGLSGIELEVQREIDRLTDLRTKQVGPALAELLTDTQENRARIEDAIRKIIDGEAREDTGDLLRSAQREAESLQRYLGFVREVVKQPLADDATVEGAQARFDNLDSALDKLNGDASKLTPEMFAAAEAIGVLTESASRLETEIRFNQQLRELRKGPKVTLSNILAPTRELRRQSLIAEGATPEQAAQISELEDQQRRLALFRGQAQRFGDGVVGGLVRSLDDALNRSFDDFGEFADALVDNILGGLQRAALANIAESLQEIGAEIIGSLIGAGIGGGVSGAQAPGGAGPGTLFPSGGNGGLEVQSATLAPPGNVNVTIQVQDADTATRTHRQLLRDQERARAKALNRE